MERVWVPSRTQAVQLTEDNVGEVRVWLSDYLPYHEVEEAYTTNGLRIGKNHDYAAIGDWVVLDILTRKAYVVYGETDRAIALGLEEEA